MKFLMIGKYSTLFDFKDKSMNLSSTGLTLFKMFKIKEFTQLEIDEKNGFDGGIPYGVIIGRTRIHIKYHLTLPTLEKYQKMET